MKKLLLVFFLIALLGCGKKEKKKVVESKFAFGTMINMVVYSDDSSKAKKSMELAFDEIKRIDDKFNTHKQDSVIYKINHNPGNFYELDEEGLYLFENVKKIYDLSKGKYDITITPLMDLWGFYDEDSNVEPKVPSDKELKKAISRVDYNNVEIKGGKIRLISDKNHVDTGSFLKGYAIHEAKKVLERNGEDSAFISAISSIETLHSKPNNETWKIGLQNPKNPSEIYHIVGISDKSMGVSGDYQTFVEINGVKYHHLIDKATGYPVKDRKMVVVIGEDGFLNDMYSTALFSMPIKDAIDYANSNKDIEIMIVKSDMTEVFSNGFEKYIIKK